MSQHKTNKAPAKNFASKLSFFAGVFSLVLLSVLAISSIILQKKVKEQNFDSRKAAQVVDVNTVSINTTPASGLSTTFETEERSSVVVSINTHANSIDGVQLFIKFEGDGNMFADNNMVVEALTAQGLRVVHLDNNPMSCPTCTNARLVRVIAITEDPTRPFTTNNNNVPLLRFNFTPRATGQVSLDFQANSFAIIHTSGVEVDLSNLTFNYNVVTNNPIQHPINWRTDDAYLQADDFYIMANGQRFTGAASYQIHSDPPNPPNVNYTTLEVIWNENGVEMRTFIYFKKNPQGWFVDEIRTYNGNVQGDWIYYSNPENFIPQRPVGQAYTNSGELVIATSANGMGELHFSNIRLQAFLQPEPAQCHYTYGSWSSCTNGWQTRSYSSGPDGCYWYQQENLQELSRQCQTGTLPTVSDYFMIYSYESCWHGDSEGHTILFAWNDDVFTNATWIDVSESPDFSNFAHKNVQDDVQPYYGWLLTNGLGFFRGNNTQDIYHFKPDTRYYVRLYNGSSHSEVLSFYMPRCGGVGGEAYRQCNESCDNNRQCAPNLTCYNNQCRLASNVDSNVCGPRPDQGLSRMCNEYCANSGECQSGYTCWWNRCRNPQNLDDQYCRAAATDTTYYYYTTTTNKGGSEVDAQCNTACQSNHQCPADYRCYNSQCRLAANPQSKSCDPSDITATSGEKGDDSATEGESDSETATSSTTTSPTPTETATGAESSLTDQENEAEIANETALDAFKKYLKDKGISPWILVLVGAGLVLVIIVLIILATQQADQMPSVYSNPSSYQKSSSTSSTSSTSPTLKPIAPLTTSNTAMGSTPASKTYGTGIVSTLPTAANQKPSTGFSSSQNTPAYGSSYGSAASYSSKPAAPVTTAKVYSPTPASTPAPTPAPVTRPVGPVSEKRVQSAYSGVATTKTPIVNKTAESSGMMDKLKNRGVTPPQTSKKS